MKILAIFLAVGMNLLSLACEESTVITSETLTAQKTLSIRIITTREEEGGEISKALPAIFMHIQAQGGVPVGAPYTRYLEYSEDKVEIETGFPIAEDFTETDKIKLSTLPATKALSLVHVGPYEAVTSCYEMIGKWLSENKKQAGEPSWEIYLNDPRTTTPDKFETRIVFPFLDN